MCVIIPENESACEGKNWLTEGGGGGKLESWGVKFQTDRNIKTIHSIVQIYFSYFC